MAKPMSKTVKNTIISVVVLALITLVCVGLLSVANQYLKYEVKLDKDTAKQLYVVCPTGEESDANALDYFEIAPVSDAIAQINAEYGNPKTKVQAVYRAKKGPNEGTYIVQAESNGRDGQIIMLTSYTAEGKIMKTRCREQSESYWQSQIAGKHDGFEALEGRDGALSSDDIATGSGATTSLSGVARAVTISNRMAAKLLEVVDDSEVMTEETAKLLYTVCPTGQPTDANAIEYFEVVDNETLIISVNTAYNDENTSVLSIYRAVSGINKDKYIVKTVSKSTDEIVMLTSYYANGTVMATKSVSRGEAVWEGVDVKLAALADTDGDVTFAATGNAEVDAVLTTVAKAVTIANRASNELHLVVKESEIDAVMAKELYAVCPTGQPTDENAAEYFEIANVYSHISRANRAYKSKKVKVITVYRAIKGINKGTIVIKANIPAVGWYGPLTMLTAYNANGTVKVTKCIEQNEGYWNVLEDKGITDFDVLVGTGGDVTVSDIATGSGATNTLTKIADVMSVSNAVAKSVLPEEYDINNFTLKQLYEICPTGEATADNAADFFEVVELTDKKDMINEKYGDARFSVVTVYRATAGTNAGAYIVKARAAAEGYSGPLVMLTAYTAEGKVMKTKCIQQTEGYWHVLVEKELTGFEGFIGKDGVVTPNDIAANSGATGTLTTVSNVVTLSNRMMAAIIGG